MGWFDKLVAAADDGMENEVEKLGWVGFIADDEVDDGVLMMVPLGIFGGITAV